MSRFSIVEWSLANFPRFSDQFFWFFPMLLQIADGLLRCSPAIAADHLGPRIAPNSSATRYVAITRCNKLGKRARIQSGRALARVIGTVKQTIENVAAASDHFLWVSSYVITIAIRFFVMANVQQIS
jgi:hypothetical protein